MEPRPNVTIYVSVTSGDTRDSGVTSSLTDDGLDVSRQPAVIQLTSSGTDLDPNSSDLINGLIFHMLSLFCCKIL